jgi:hypothetical protein
VAALTDSVDPHGYIKDMRRRDPEIAKGWGQIATPFSFATLAARKTSIAPALFHGHAGHKPLHEVLSGRAAVAAGRFG